jgi:hypothetical protein
MSLALIRFVNGLLDPLQRANKSLSLSMLAREAGLPTVFVEIRHWGTHERDLPGEEVLRDMGVRAVEWLYTEYWKKLDGGEAIWRRWKEGKVGENDVVEGIRSGGRRGLRELIEELSLDEDFEESKTVWEALWTSCTVRLPMLPEMVVDCMVEMLISIPQCTSPKGLSLLADSLTEEKRSLAHPDTVISWAIHLLSCNGPWEGDQFSRVARRCLAHPHTLFVSPNSPANLQSMGSFATDIGRGA